MPFPSSKKSHFQSEAKCVAIDMKMIFYYEANKTHFHNKGFALSLVLKAKFLELGNGLFHLPENDREGLKLVSKMTLKKLNTNFCLEYPVRKNRTTFTDVPLLLEIFRWNDQKSHVLFTFQPDFPESFCKW